MEKQEQTERSRPVEESSLEIADTFQDAGTRPIEESPDFLTSEEENSDDLKRRNIEVGNPSQSEINSTPPLD